MEKSTLSKASVTEAEKVHKRTRARKRFLSFLPLYLMMIPGLVYLIINNYLPMAGLVIAFKKIDYSLGIFKRN